LWWSLFEQDHPFLDPWRQGFSCSAAKGIHQFFIFNSRTNHRQTWWCRWRRWCCPSWHKKLFHRQSLTQTLVSQEMNNFSLSNERRGRENEMRTWKIRKDWISRKMMRTKCDKEKPRREGEEERKAMEWKEHESRGWWILHSWEKSE
jgi:hypothetical protein